MNVLTLKQYPHQLDPERFRLRMAYRPSNPFSYLVAARAKDFPQWREVLSDRSLLQQVIDELPPELRISMVLGDVSIYFNKAMRELFPFTGGIVRYNHETKKWSLTGADLDSAEGDEDKRTVMGILKSNKKGTSYGMLNPWYPENGELPWHPFGWFESRGSTNLVETLRIHAANYWEWDTPAVQAHYKPTVGYRVGKIGRENIVALRTNIHITGEELQAISHFSRMKPKGEHTLQFHIYRDLQTGAIGINPIFDGVLK